MLQMRSITVSACFFALQSLKTAIATETDARNGTANGLSRDCFECKLNSFVPTQSPVDIVYPETYNDRDWRLNHSIDFLVVAFFLVAAGWLVVALMYSVLVLVVIRLRARGELDIYDENFGRIFLLGTRCYIPLGCILRRYVVALHTEQDTEGNPAHVRYMTREERREAMESLLLVREDDENSSEGDIEQGQTDAIEEPDTTAANDGGNKRDGSEEESSEEPVCSICLTEYETTDLCFSSSTCPHRFHRSCIMEWLERRTNTECPICRVSLVSDDDVWETVQRIRSEKRKRIQFQNRKGCFMSILCCRPRNDTNTDMPQQQQQQQAVIDADDDEDNGGSPEEEEVSSIRAGSDDGQTLDAMVDPESNETDQPNHENSN